MLVKLPTDSVTSGGKELDAVAVIRSMVLVLPFWKNGSDIKLVDACLEIEGALDLCAASEHDRPLTISIDAHGFLRSAMSLKDASILDPLVNRFYMRVFSAVLKAI